MTHGVGGQRGTIAAVPPQPTIDVVAVCTHGTVIACVLVGRFTPFYCTWQSCDVSVLHAVTVFVFWSNEVTRESLEPLLAIPDIVISLW